MYKVFSLISLRKLQIWLKQNKKQNKKYHLNGPNILLYYFLYLYSVYLLFDTEIFPHGLWLFSVVFCTFLLLWDLLLLCNTRIAKHGHNKNMIRQNRLHFFYCKCIFKTSMSYLLRCFTNFHSLKWYSNVLTN